AGVKWNAPNSVGRDGAEILGAGSCTLARDQVGDNGPDIPQADEAEDGREEQDHEVGPRWGQGGLRPMHLRRHSSSSRAAIRTGLSGATRGTRRGTLAHGSRGRGASPHIIRYTLVRGGRKLLRAGVI